MDNVCSGFFYLYGIGEIDHSDDCGFESSFF